MKINPETVKAQIGVLLHEHPLIADDEELLSGMIEGETDLHDLLRQVVKDIGETEAMCKALEAYMATLDERIARMEARNETRRNLILKLMELAHLSKAALPEATLSIRAKPRALVGNGDPDAMPDEFVRIKRTIDRTAIKNALMDGRAVEGFALDNGGVSLSIRRA
jgi:phage shock protein A